MANRKKGSSSSGSNNQVSLTPEDGPAEHVVRSGKAYEMSIDNELGIGRIAQIDREISEEEKKLGKSRDDAERRITQLGEERVIRLDKPDKVGEFEKFILYLKKNNLPMWKGKVIAAGQSKKKIKSEVEGFINNTFKLRRNVNIEVVVEED